MSLRVSRNSLHASMFDIKYLRNNVLFEKCRSCTITFSFQRNKRITYKIPFTTQTNSTVYFSAYTSVFETIYSRPSLSIVPFILENLPLDYSQQLNYSQLSGPVTLQHTHIVESTQLFGMPFPSDLPFKIFVDITAELLLNYNGRGSAANTTEVHSTQQTLY